MAQQIKKDFYLWAQIAQGTMAACTAVTISNPFEVVKTKLQLQGELQKAGVYTKAYRGMADAFFQIIKNEGIGTKGLQKGLPLAYPYTSVMNGTRLGCYPKAKTKIAELSGFSETSYQVGCLAGGFTGVLGTILANPFYVAKTRLQAQVNKLAAGASVGYQHHYKGSLDALISIYKQEGWVGYFRGLAASSYRIFVASAVQLATYDKAKLVVLRYNGGNDNIPSHLQASILSSLVLAIVLNPFDVILTRLQNQKVVDGKGVTYSGWLDCFLKSLRTEGLTGFYKGIVPHYGRLAPHTVTLFLVLEQAKRLFSKFDIGFVENTPK